MRFTREPTFRPITVVLDSEEELQMLLQVLQMASSSVSKPGLAYAFAANLRETASK